MCALKRPLQEMPDEVRNALTKTGLRTVYEERPPYQRNDYLWWINSAKKPATKQRRLEKMLDELSAGHGYMGMSWSAKSRAKGIHG
jgi:uncharacterized protein YdeI (YjbR/CyaY-like superfamily)